MSMKGTNKIYMYKVTFGAEVDNTDSRQTQKVFRNLYGKRETPGQLQNVFGPICNFSDQSMFSNVFIE